MRAGFKHRACVLSDGAPSDVWYISPATCTRACADGGPSDIGPCEHLHVHWLIYIAALFVAVILVEVTAYMGHEALVVYDVGTCTGSG